MPRVVVCSEFFNGPEMWSRLENSFLPALLKEHSCLRVLSAGCAAGKEPFSAAILLDQLSPGQRHEIIAVDNNTDMLARAEAGGPFRARDLRWLDEPFVQSYFERVSDEFYVRPALKRAVSFQRLDLLTEPLREDCHVIFFRDLETCFTAEQLALVYRKIHRALAPGGLLFVGAIDGAPATSIHGLVPLEPGFYRKECQLAARGGVNGSWN